jgi:hypothetical protein
MYAIALLEHDPTPSSGSLVDTVGIIVLVVVAVVTIWLTIRPRHEPRATLRRVLSRQQLGAMMAAIAVAVKRWLAEQLWKRRSSAAGRTSE